MPAMRIGNRNCTLLGDDPKTWPKHAPSLPPAWYENEVTKFADVVRLAAAGNLEEAKSQLRLIRSDELRTWYGYAERLDISGVTISAVAGRKRVQHFWIHSATQSLTNFSFIREIITGVDTVRAE